MTKPLAAALAAILLSGCATTAATRDAPGDDRDDAKASASSFMDDPYPSTYQAAPAQAVLITGATVLTGTGQRLDNADVLLRDGRIVAVSMSMAMQRISRRRSLNASSCSQTRRLVV